MFRAGMLPVGKSRRPLGASVRTATTTTTTMPLSAGGDSDVVAGQSMKPLITPEETTVVGKEHEEEEDDETVLGSPDPAARTYVDNITPMISSVFTSLFAVTLLYAVAAQREIWVAVFGVITVFIVAGKKAVAKHLYTKMERDDIDNLMVMLGFRFAQANAMFIVTKVIFDLTAVLWFTSVMYWYDYIFVLALAFIFAFAIFTKIQ